ncbi:TerC family protein [Rhizobium giardinii]|jgi:YjbE family integral membrane protein|uniref:YjbE family integral membrane protein n=1 Tax=Rhizobium giardinii TaxID=56731 RepID=A0A7W8XBA6_9HYPH|nr:TerC family protein [Rhizobium giardinii]MBB5537528.1 YjbE family integral membrane protein [Rhizobium giardinii]
MDALIALLQVLAIDLVLAGDNAIVIGLAAAGLPKEQRGKAILIGIAAATVLRIVFALLTTQLLQILGLLLVGGILLLWVCWKMWRELRTTAKEEAEGLESLTGEDMDKNGTIGGAPRKTLKQAAIQIVVADVSMSLDNVLAVAGAAREHPNILIIGLAVSVALMGVAASFIAKLLHRFHWISYVGLAIILFVALKMIYEGFMEVEPVLTSSFL